MFKLFCKTSNNFCIHVCHYIVLSVYHGHNLLVLRHSKIPKTKLTVCCWLASEHTDVVSCNGRTRACTRPRKNKNDNLQHVGTAAMNCHERKVNRLITAKYANSSIECTEVSADPRLDLVRLCSVSVLQNKTSTSNCSSKTGNDQHVTSDIAFANWRGSHSVKHGGL